MYHLLVGGTKLGQPQAWYKISASLLLAPEDLPLLAMTVGNQGA